MSDYTPGPWVWTGVEGCNHLFGKDSELIMFEVGGLFCKGDARLIAAAPEMFEALKNALDFIQCADVPEEQVFDLQESTRIVRAAIAKAEGEQL